MPANRLASLKAYEPGHGMEDTGRQNIRAKAGEGRGVATEALVGLCLTDEPLIV